MKSLKGKLILATCMICIICLGITASVSYFNASGKLKSKESENALLLAEKSAGEIQTWMKKQVAFLNTTAVSIEADGSTEYNKLCSYLTYLLENYNEDDTLYDIYYTSMENKMSAASGYVQEPGIDFTQRSWFTGALDTNGIYYESPYKDVDSGRIVITISRKIMVNGKTTGILAEDIFVDTVVDITNQCEVPDNSYAMLLDNKLGLAVHPNNGYGYVDDEPVLLKNLEGNPYREIALMLENGTQEAVSVNDYDGVQRTMFAASVEECQWTLLVAVDKAVLNSAQYSMLKGFAIAIASSLFIGILIISMVAGRIAKPVRQLANTVATRDFTSEIKINSKDEIGRLANGFNEMFHSLERLLETFEDASESTKKSAVVLSNITKEIVDGADNIKDKMDGISGTVEIQNHSVEQGRDKLEHFQNQIGSFNQQFADMKDIVNNISGRIGENTVITKELKTAAAVSIENIENLQSGVQTLEEKSRHITNIVATITQISSQTNLLALNASIEAARAGEAGKGFAVVADEIRNLSEQTNDASCDIQLLVTEIQSQIGGTVNGIGNVARLFETNYEVAEKVQDFFDEINASIEVMDRHNKELYQGLQEFAEAKDNITTAFEEIEYNTSSCLSFSEQALDITVKQTEDVFQLKEFAQSLDALSTELNEKLEGFKV